MVDLQTMGHMRTFKDWLGFKSLRKEGFKDRVFFYVVVRNRLPREEVEIGEEEVSFRSSYGDPGGTISARFL